MSDNGINGRHYPRPARGLEDDGVHPELAKPCCARVETTTHYGHCFLPDGHTGPHEVPQRRYDHPVLPSDHRVMAKRLAPKTTTKPAVAPTIVWPAIGASFRDGDRVFTVHEVNPDSTIDRHVIGVVETVDSSGARVGPRTCYACSGPVFDALWRATERPQP